MTDLEEDFLSTDTPIPGQNFVCLSFVSPEKTLKDKNIFLLHKFLSKEASNYQLELEDLEEKFSEFTYNNKKKLEDEFYEKNDFHTTVRGLKVRGVFDTKREAEVRAKVLQRKDKNFHVFVGQVGYWLPWDPDADEIESEEYSDKELNKLVKKYNENKVKKDEYFQQHKEKCKKNKAETVESKVVKEEPSETEDKEEDNILSELDKKDPWLERKMECKDGSLDIDKL